MRVSLRGSVRSLSLVGAIPSLSLTPSVRGPRCRCNPSSSVRSLRGSVQSRFVRRCDPTSQSSVRCPSLVGASPRRCRCELPLVGAIPLRWSVRSPLRWSVRAALSLVGASVSSRVGASPLRGSVLASSLVGAIPLRWSVRSPSLSVQSFVVGAIPLRSSVRGLFAGRCDPTSLVGASSLRWSVRGSLAWSVRAHFARRCEPLFAGRCESLVRRSSCRCELASLVGAIPLRWSVRSLLFVGAIAVYLSVQSSFASQYGPRESWVRTGGCLCTRDIGPAWSACLRRRRNRMSCIAQA